MQANPKVMKHLNTILGNELVAINQYFLHGRMCQNWGYTSMAEKILKESHEEMQHADSLIQRILQLDGVPSMEYARPLDIGSDLRQVLEKDLRMEEAGYPQLQAAVASAFEEGDQGSRILLENILQAEEEHIDWLRTQLSLIQQLGLENYLLKQT